MTVLTLVIYTIAAFGLAYIVGHSTISLPIRQWLGGVTLPSGESSGGRWGRGGELLVTLIECPACFGFWTGLVAGLCWPGRPWYLAFGTALFTTGSNFILARLTGLI